MKTKMAVLPTENLGLLLGFLGVITFALSLPMTRLAVGDISSPGLSPIFVTLSRAAIAGVLSIFYLILKRAPKPRKKTWPALFVSGIGTVIGFPLFLALALQDTNAMHAAVVTGILPLGTAVCAALYFRQRPSLGFWICAFSGTLLVIIFAVYKGGGGLSRGDLFLFGAIASASIGYVAGAKAASEMPSSLVICWILAIAFLPIGLATFWYWPIDKAPWQSYAGVLYLGVFPMWLGFFAWYRGLVLGGTVRVSQVQLIQPFLALLFAVPILGESLDITTVMFSLSVIVVVFISKKMRV